MKKLITVGSSGIGRPTARKLQEKGHKAIIFDKKEQDIDIDFYQGNVRDEERVEKVVK